MSLHPTGLVSSPEVLAQRKLLEEEVKALPSPSLWTHAFPSSASGACTSPTGSLCLPSESISSGIAGDLEWLGDSDSGACYNQAIDIIDSVAGTLPNIDDEHRTRHATFPRAKPRGKYTFTVGNSEHEDFSSAIAALMITTSNEPVLVKTPEAPSGPRRPSPHKGSATKAGSDCVISPFRIPFTPTSQSVRAGKGAMSRSLPLPNPIITSPTPPKMSSGTPVLMLSTESQSADPSSVKKGRFEVRRL
ncbi:hypothetical protein BC830DRAFT_1095976 [Chytriomyces sp. MP71]|nr:hypothetical protein BC830DRAFT_1095976 [Chytriomyces sp. MP71]